MKKKKEKAKSKKNSCKYLYIDVFGHPYCSDEFEKANDCKYFLPSEEYKIMKQQIDLQRKSGDKNTQNLFKVPSTYRCTIYDDHADKHGHLPENMRPKLDKKFAALTIKF